MIYFKKLFFAPLFLITFFYCTYQANQLIKLSTNLVFSLEISSFIALISFSVFIILASLFFVLTITLSQDFKFTLPLALIASLSPLIFSQKLESIFLAAIFLISLVCTNLYLQSRLKTYITFSTNSLVVSPTKALAKILILCISLLFFMNIKADIEKNGFHLPDSLIDTAISLSAPQGLDTIDGVQVKGAKYLAQNITLTPEQIDLLKQNPDTLRQFGVDPKMLDQLNNQNLQFNPQNITQGGTQTIAKNLIKTQVDTLLKPYLIFIAPLLALLFFGTVYSLASLIMLPLPLLVWLIFSILESSKFLSFQKEIREVKKLVV
jgi:hypothetical protein